ncbi:hypothetical protein BJ912DRAFT_1067938 [Pholiota molesta]|nr:hypothetical protein BJ912DRAFT_1067938 [Pholiota molesta]
MTIAALTVAHLKQVKNSVIGNPQAKSKHAHDPAFIATLVDAVNPAPTTPSESPTAHDALAIEAAVVIASLSASDAALLALLCAQAPRALLYALSRLPPPDRAPGHAPLRAALARALRALAAGTADVVGPALWGLLKQPARELLDEARRSADVVVSTEALDVYLPLLVLPATTGPPAAAAVSTATAVAQLLAAAVRTPAQVALVTACGDGGGGMVPRSKRGWEKTAVPGAGGVPCVVRYLLALLAGGSKDNKLVEAVLNALAALVKDNPVLAGHLGRGSGEKEALPLTTIMAFTKSRASDVQIAACLWCVSDDPSFLPVVLFASFLPFCDSTFSILAACIRRI